MACKDKGEIDTKPIEPVQVALSLFGQKGDQRKIDTSSEEMAREKDIEILLRDLANCKVQLDAKDSTSLQLQFKLEHCLKTSEELSTALKNSELERESSTDALRWTRCRISELESKVKDMADVVSETQKLKEQLLNVESELKATKGELLRVETELAAAREGKVKALAQAELIEIGATVEKERAEELLEHANKMNESIFKSKLAVEQAEKEKSMAVSKKDAEIKKQLEMVEELENLRPAKSAYIDSLRKDINNANKKLDSSDRPICDDMDDWEQMKADVKGEKAENSDQELFVGAFGTELNRLKLELLNANDEIIRLNHEAEMLIDELEKVKTEMNEVKVRENEAEVEIALLKYELHKGRSELAAAKAAEARAVSAKSGLYLAVQQLALEAEEVKMENQRLKQGADKVNEESDGFGLVDSEDRNASQLVEESHAKSKAEAEEKECEKDGKITVSHEEYHSLYAKSTSSDKNCELENLKEEIEAAMAKIVELRTRTEQAVSRAEAAEKAKMSLEDQLKAWRDRKQKRKAARAALREESSYGLSPDTYGGHLKAYEPLGKVLNIEP